jgi:hypothetical protein
MAAPKNDKHKKYARYAVHCLEIVPAIPDQEYRTVQREMAAEWLRLADTILHPLKAGEMIGAGPFPTRKTNGPFRI